MKDASIESSLEGMTAKRAVFKLAEVLAVARRGHSWVWIAQWLRERGVKSQRGSADKTGALSVDALSNYFSEAKKLGLVNEDRVERLVKELDERLRAETLQKVGTGEALSLLVRIAAESRQDDAAPAMPAPSPTLAPAVASPVAKTGAARLIVQPQRKYAPAEPFERLREMVIRNLSLPKGERTEFFPWSGRQLKLNAARQILIRDGVVKSLEELTKL